MHMLCDRQILEKPPPLFPMLGSRVLYVVSLLLISVAAPPRLQASLSPLNSVCPFRPGWLKRGKKRQRKTETSLILIFHNSTSLLGMCGWLTVSVWEVCACMCVYVCVVVGIFIQASLACGYWLVVWVLVGSKGKGGGTPWLPYCHRHTGTTEPVQVPLSKIRSLSVCLCVRVNIVRFSDRLCDFRYRRLELMSFLTDIITCACASEKKRSCTALCSVFFLC